MIADERLIFKMQNVRGIQTFSFLFPQNNTPTPPPTTLFLLHSSYKKQFHKIDKFGKNIYMLVTHSFLTQVTDLFLILTYIVLMTHTQLFSISCFDCQSILWIVKTHAIRDNKSQHCCILRVFGQQCCIHLHGPESLTSFKLHATGTNKCQHCCGTSGVFFCNPKIS